MADAGSATDTPIEADDRRRRFHILGDSRSKLNGEYQLAIEGAFAFGWWKSYKDGVLHKWHSKSANMTATEREALKAKIEERRKVAQAEAKARAKAARDKAERLWARGTDALQHPYLARKGVPSYGLRVLHNLLMIPALDPKGISTIQFISEKGEKKFLTGGEKKGAFFTIPGTGGRAVCEGYATGGTIHRATGWEVRVAFDSGNLKAVAEEGDIICADFDNWVFRSGKRPPDLVLLPAGDDPRWKEWRESGLLWNPGIEAAEAVSKRLGGKVRVVPPKFDNVASRPTDFNDLEAQQGLDAVRALLLKEPEPEIPYDNDNPPPPEDLSGMVPHYDPDNLAEPVENGPFKIMGHNMGQYYYLPRGSKQMVALTPGGHTKNNLYELAPKAWWEEGFKKDRGKDVDWDYAVNALLQTSQKIGIFKPESMIRGAGVWIDEGRVVIHCGDRLLVDGKPMDPFMIGSRYVYQAAEKIFEIDPEPLESIEAVKLRKICEAPTWENPLSGTLLAGWLVMAPLCAALDWRPHIWVTGESQAGKSFVLNKVMMPMIDIICLRLSGGTTEPAIRQLLQWDGRPVVLDEMETENQRDDINVQQILMLARKSSSGDRIAKGSQDGQGVVYSVRSMFAFASINPSIKQRADESRVSMLYLRRNRAPDAEQQFQDLKAFAKETLTEKYARQLLARTVSNIKVIMKNSETFTDAAATVLRDRRAADQIGPMLAGVYSLHSPKEISVKEAEEWIRKHDWTLHTAVGEAADHDRLYDRLMSSTIPVLQSFKGQRHEAQIGTVIQVALGYVDMDYTQQDARAALLNVDIKTTQEFVYIRRPSMHISRILKETIWATNWAKAIINAEGIKWNEPKKLVRFGATTANQVIIPSEKFRPDGLLL